MDYIVKDNEIIYLHKIKDGVAGSSLTLLAAKTAGLSDAAVERSQKIINGEEPCRPNPELKITKSMHE